MVMMVFIEVVCPHCGAQGRVMAPVSGGIVVGPCPSCQGMVAIVCGHALALNGNIMRYGSKAKRRAHLMTVVGRFLETHLDQAAEEYASGAEADGLLDEADTEQEPVGQLELPELGLDSHGHLSDGSPAITDEEIEEFLKRELQMIDNKDYFKAVFG